MSARKLGGGSLVIATHNAGKLKEISDLLAPFGLDCLSAGALGLPEPAETGTTFVEHALLKARAAAVPLEICPRRCYSDSRCFRGFQASARRCHVDHHHHPHPTMRAQMRS